MYVRSIGCLVKGESMTIRVRKGGVYDYEPITYPAPTKRELRTQVPVYRMDSEIQCTLQTLKGALSADHKADSRGRRFIRLHGIGIGVIRKDKRCNGQELRLFAQFTASGKEEKVTCKSIQECLVVAGTKL